MSINPYDIAFESLKESRVITDERELLKFRLAAYFIKVTAKMETDEILALTGLHKSDLSRIRMMSVSRFSIDRIIGLLDLVGFTTKLTVMPKKVS